METQTLDLAREFADVLGRYAVDVVGALLLLVAGWIVAAWARTRTRRALERIERVDATLRPLLANIVRYAILLLVAVGVLAQFGVQTTSIIAVLGAAGIGVALALQGTLSNVAAGIMLLFLRPFKLGEYIDADGIAGTVTEIGLFTTQFTTFDGVFLSAPNAALWNRAIKNYSRLPTRRLDLVVGISYDDDIDAAMTMLQELLAADPRVLAEPAAQVMVKELADSSVNINLRCWANAAEYWNLLFDLTKGAKQRLDAGGITIPFPQRDVHLFEAPSGEGERAAAA